MSDWDWGNMGGAAMRMSVHLEIEHTIATIPEVERVYVSPGENSGDLYVLTIVDKEDDRVYELIYANESQLRRALPGTRFDFAVIARDGRPVDQIVGQNRRPAWERLSEHGNPERTH